MCGIHGIIDKQLTKHETAQIMGKMLQSTIHRGPDFQDFKQDNFITLGHNRLSIIDLTSFANQPLKKENLTIVFNGEIYNYLEIKKELQLLGSTFSTESDTEVVVESYKKWGKEALNRFLGMWSFAIWDENKEELFCSRDRFGIKPFYYIFENGRFYFASEVKALKYSPLFSTDLNLNQVSKALQMGWLEHDSETFYAKIKSLEPAHHLIWKNNCIQIDKFWEINSQENKRNDREKSVNEFKTLFDDALNLHLRSDVPIGATLSGGIDSSSLVCSIVKENLIPNLSTFSVYYQGNKSVDERPFIEEIVKKYPSGFKTYYTSPSENDVLEHFHKATFHNDFPLLGSSPMSQYFVMKLISEQGIKVVLSGQGADDYLGGYMHSYYRLFAEYLKSFQLGKFFKEFKEQRKKQEYGFKKTIDVALKSFLSLVLNEEQLYNFEYNHYNPKAVSSLKNDKIKLVKSTFNKFNSFHQNLIQTSSLPSLLHYEDRNSMAFSIESRVPFLDHRLLEFAFNIPTEYKIHEGWTKWILRESMKNRLPEKIRYRTDKKGFVTPGEVIWLRGKLKFLLEIDYQRLDFLNKSIIDKEILAFQNGNDKNANFIWRIASLNYWIKNFG
jgi:asparagine synthase (glutamine-hydrolysing)